MRWILTITLTIAFLVSIVGWIWGENSLDAHLRLNSSLFGLEHLTFYSYQSCAGINADACLNLEQGRGLSWRTPRLPFFGALGIDFMDAGFRWRDGRQVRYKLARVIFPWWPVVALTGLGVLRGVRLISRDLRLQRAPSLCKSCGYDFRAGHEKCPECGADSHVKALESAAP